MLAGLLDYLHKHIMYIDIYLFHFGHFYVEDKTNNNNKKKIIKSEITNSKYKTEEHTHSKQQK